MTHFVVYQYDINNIALRCANKLINLHRDPLRFPISNRVSHTLWIDKLVSIDFSSYLIWLFGKWIAIYKIIYFSANLAVKSPYDFILYCSTIVATNFNYFIDANYLKTLLINSVKVVTKKLYKLLLNATPHHRKM